MSLLHIIQINSFLSEFNFLPVFYPCLISVVLFSCANVGADTRACLLSLSYISLAVLVRKCWGRHSCLSSVAVLY